jgi:predicted nucleic acid-binding protein
VLTGDIELLPKLFERVLVPQVVRGELANTEAPQAVSDWVARAPGWLDVRPAHPGTDDVAVAKLDDGECAAIALALAVKAELVPMDDREGVGIARDRGLDAAQVRTAHAEILASAKAYAPQARIIGVSVQEMVGEGVEVIIGVSCDPQLGPVLLFGSAGVMVEVYNDVALQRCPITRSEAQAMIAEVKGARLLRGFRGRPAADREARGYPGARVAPRHAP